MALDGQFFQDKTILIDFHWLAGKKEKKRKKKKKKEKRKNKFSGYILRSLESPNVNCARGRRAHCSWVVCRLVAFCFWGGGCMAWHQRACWLFRFPSLTRCRQRKEVEKEVEEDLKPHTGRQKTKRAKSFPVDPFNVSTSMTVGVDERDLLIFYSFAKRQKGSPLQSSRTKVEWTPRFSLLSFDLSSPFFYLRLARVALRNRFSSQLTRWFSKSILRDEPPYHFRYDLQVLIDLGFIIRSVQP